jgi:transcriptional regulator with XRE-family HTH domain
MDTNQPWHSQTQALGAFIRAQRRLADLSLREMATLTSVSNAYLSQIERGLHQPSVRVLSAIARALDVPPDELLAEAGLVGNDRSAPAGADEREQSGTKSANAHDHVCSTEEAILADPALTEDQRRALMGVYRSFLPAEPPAAQPSTAPS